ncbi:MAG: class I SAM-dependent methyltransferase [Betaproteobacteria bacterium]|jgi:SAM-dependent methyltransferase|nr:class I SAM-dependent methyltransferase [Betaproteobacteria bacterium]
MTGMTTIELEFSRKYDHAHSARYYRKHRDGLARRLSHAWDTRLARKALVLAGNPGRVLDLPCGAGRFWPLLAEREDREILAADNSSDMIGIALAQQPAHIVSRVRTFRTSAFAIELPDRSVDSIFCMRLLHHVRDSAHRLAMLREFHRVTEDSVIVSLWVDGNYKAWKRARLERRRAGSGKVGTNANRFVVPRAVIEQEFAQAGFTVQSHLDFLPGYAMWRVYVLRKAA